MRIVRDWSDSERLIDCRALRREQLRARGHVPKPDGLGARAQRYQDGAAERMGDFVSFHGDDALPRLLAHNVDVVCIATPGRPAVRAA